MTGINLSKIHKPPGPNPVTLTRLTSYTLQVKGDPGTCRPAHVICTVCLPTASGVYVAVYRPSPVGDTRVRTLVPPGPATYTAGSPALKSNLILANLFKISLQYYVDRDKYYR